MITVQGLNLKRYIIYVKRENGERERDMISYRRRFFEWNNNIYIVILTRGVVYTIIV